MDLFLLVETIFNMWLLCVLQLDPKVPPEGSAMEHFSSEDITDITEDKAPQGLQGKSFTFDDSQDFHHTKRVCEAFKQHWTIIWFFRRHLSGISCWCYGPVWQMGVLSALVHQLVLEDNCYIPSSSPISQEPIGGALSWLALCGHLHQ